MFIGLLAAIVAAFGYGTSSVLQAYGAQRAAAAAEARGTTNHRTATGGSTLTSTIAAALTIWFVIGTCLDVDSFVAAVIAARFPQSRRGARPSTSRWKRFGIGYCAGDCRTSRRDSDGQEPARWWRAGRHHDTDHHRAALIRRPPAQNLRKVSWR